MRKLRDIRSAVVPGTMRPAILGTLGMVAVPSITIPTGWNDTTIGGWAGPAMVVVIFMVAFRSMNKARKRWDATRTLVSETYIKDRNN